MMILFAFWILNFFKTSRGDKSSSAIYVSVVYEETGYNKNGGK